MANEDRILKILLQLKADTADTAKVTAGLKEIEVQAEKTAAGGGRERPIIHEHIIVADLDAAIDRRMHSTAHIKTIVHAMDTYRP